MIAILLPVKISIKKVKEGLISFILMEDCLAKVLGGGGSKYKGIFAKPKLVIELIGTYKLT